MEAVRQCQVAIIVAERVRESHLHSKQFSTGSVIILPNNVERSCGRAAPMWRSRHYVASINPLQQCRELEEASLEVAAPDEGVRARDRVERSEIPFAMGFCQFPLCR